MYIYIYIIKEMQLKYIIYMMIKEMKYIYISEKKWN